MISTCVDFHNVNGEVDNVATLETSLLPALKEKSLALKPYKRASDDEIIVTSFRVTRRASSPLAFPIMEENTASSAGTC